MRVARRGPPGGWRNPRRGTSTGCGHAWNQLCACWHSCPTSTGCEAAKKWSLARSSVYRMLFSAKEGAPVKRATLLPGSNLPWRPLLPSLHSQDTHPHSQCTGQFPASKPLPMLLPLPGMLPPPPPHPLSHANHLLVLILAQRSLPLKAFSSPTLQSPHPASSGLITVTI